MESSDQLQPAMPKRDRVVHFTDSIGTPLAIDMEDTQVATVLSNLVTCIESPPSRRHLKQKAICSVRGVRGI